MYNDKKATYEYDEANNLIKEVSEYGLTESYEYDGDGNMTSLTKNDGTTIEYTYDALGRKLSEGSRTFSYDAYDNLTEASYNDKTISYTYDKYNNITKVDDANNNVIEYKWDIYGNKTELKYKDYTISYTYNQFDKINKISKNNEDYAEYTYDSRGNTKSLARNGVITNYEYDDLNRRISYNNSKGDTVLSTYQYEYDGEDNIISETINGVVNTYEYNELDELNKSIKSVDGIAVTTEYKYDIYGNKIESSSDGTSKIYRYNDKNQLVNIKSAEGLTDIYYDQNGNIRDIYYAGGYKEYYQYDEFGQLVILKTNKDRTYNYEYDAQGDRINEKKTVENRYAVDYEKDSKEWYDYIQTLPFDEVKELLEEKDSNESFDALRYQLTYKKKKGICASNLVQDPKSNEKCTETTYTLDKTVEDALIISANDDFSIYGEERIETISEDESILYLSGLNQSVMDTVTTTDKKETVSHIEYDDFGNSTDIKDGFGYDGEKLDVTGNIYLRARYYNPRIGQFVQIDTYRGIQEDITSQNRYTYCLNNQYKYTDPSEHKSVFSILANTLSMAISVPTRLSSSVRSLPKPDTGKKSIAAAINSAVNINLDVITATSKIANSIKKAVVKEPEPCPYENMTLVSQYKTIYSCIYNHVGDGRATARSKIKISSYDGEPYNLLSYAINILEDVRGYAINEKKSSYNSALSKIATYAKSFKYLGGEFKTEVTGHAKNMYSNITSNHSPYKEVNIWINDFEYIISHPHKDSDAYKVFSSDLYIYTTKIGQIIDACYPIISLALEKISYDYAIKYWPKANMTWNEFQKYNKGCFNKKDMSFAWKLYKMLWKDGIK